MQRGESEQVDLQIKLGERVQHLFGQALTTSVGAALFAEVGIATPSTERLSCQQSR